MKRRKLRALSYAKINLSLNVSGKTESGLHRLSSVTASVGLFDAVTVCERFDSEINVTYNGVKSPYERDSVIKAIMCMRKRFGDFGLDVAVEKHLPEGAGIGGSSADAAAVLVLANELFSFFSRGFDPSVTAKEVGSDVPVMCEGGYCTLNGIGEKISKFDGEKLDLVLCAGGGGVPTDKCFKLFDEMYPNCSFYPADNEKLIGAIKANDLSAIAVQCKNALTEPAIRLNSNIEKRIDFLLSSGAVGAFMTGSGSGCVGLFRTKEQAENAADEINTRAGMEGRAYALETVKRGVKII